MSAPLGEVRIKHNNKVGRTQYLLGCAMHSAVRDAAKTTLCALSLNSDFWWPPMEKPVFYFLDKFCSYSPTSEGCKAWLCWPRPKPRFLARGKSAPPPAGIRTVMLPDYWSRWLDIRKYTLVTASDFLRSKTERVHLIRESCYVLTSSQQSRRSGGCHAFQILG